jgi:hypothetical protein
MRRHRTRTQDKEIIVSTRKKVLLSVVALAMPLALVSVGTSGAAFAGTKPPPFTGNATGTVHCTPDLSIKFAAPLTFASTAPDAVALKGSLKDCVTSAGSNVKDLKGKVTGGFTVTGGCGGIASGTEATVNLTVAWKGKSAAGGKATISNTAITLHGASSVINSSNDVGFELPNLNTPTGSVTGSFAGPVSESTTYTTTTESEVGSLCLPSGSKPAKGIKKLSVKTGTVNVP